ncbi:MAG: response regulator [Cyanobacteria bacterium J06635_1]
MRILLVDSDEYLQAMLQKSLMEHGYAVDSVSDGESALSYCSFMVYDLLILKAGMPIDGIGLCRQLRQQGQRVPILLLTEQDNSPERINGLNAGADDCLTKPFNLEELNARVRTLLRRESLPQLPIFKQGELRVDFNTFEVTYSGHELNLTPKEYALMALFCQSPQRVFTLQDILDRLWDLEEPPQESTVRAHIKGLRQELKTAGAPTDLVETVYGIGYRLKPTDQPEPSKVLFGRRSTDRLAPIEPPGQDKTAHLIARAKAWQQCKEHLLSYLTSLKQAAVALATPPLPDQLQQDARFAAHRLAGTLGSFGLSTGSQIAQTLDQLLRLKTPLPLARATEFQGLVDALEQAMHESPPTQVGMPIPKTLLLIVNANAELNQQVTTTAKVAEIQTAIAPSFNEAIKSFEKEASLPDVVLLNIYFDRPTVDEAMAFLEYVSQEHPQVPVLVIAENAQMLERLAVASRGGRLFLDSPVTPEQVINAIAQALHSSPTNAKILIVDDDPYLLHLLQTLLAPWRFEITVLDQPQAFWAVLHEVEPDLVVLDFDMPEITGIQLCQLLRSDPRWAQLPVLFLTVYTDAAVETEIFAVGADDYLNKPVTADALANRILNRLARVRRRLI